MNLPSHCLRSLTCLLGGALVFAACSGYGKPDAPATDLAFGVDMAKRGLWNEAMFRFQAAARAEPQNPRVQSNLGVAYEAQGNFEKALEHYKQALQLAPDDKQIRANYARFVEFYQAYKNPAGKQGKGFGKGVLGAPLGGKGSSGGTPPGAPAGAPPPAGGQPSPPTGLQPPAAEPQAPGSPPPPPPTSAAPPPPASPSPQPQEVLP